MQHGASASEGRAAAAVRRDLAGLPLPQHPSAVGAGALLRGRAQAGSIPQAALLPPQTGPGQCRQMEGWCEVLSSRSSTSEKPKYHNLVNWSIIASRRCWSHTLCWRKNIKNPSFSSSQCCLLLHVTLWRSLVFSKGRLISRSDALLDGAIIHNSTFLFSWNFL